jgi:Family of unknown function (DUF5343)
VERTYRLSSRAFARRQAPKNVDTEWVKAYKLAAKQPEGIPSLLKWLGIVNQDGSAKPEVWDAVRLPQSRPAALEPLVREAYSDVFDRIDVEQVGTEELEATFVIAYGMGNADRHVRCFLVLCELAGIPTATAKKPATAKGEADTRTKQPAKEQKQRTPARGAGAQHVPPPPPQGSVILSLSVEIPAEWNKDQIRERVLAVSQVLSEAQLGGA